MFSIKDNGPYFEAALESMTDQEITTKIKGASERLSDQTISESHRQLLLALVAEGSSALKYRWFGGSVQRIM